MGVRENSQSASWVHSSNRVCSSLCSLGRDFDPRDPVFPGTCDGPRTYYYVLVVDCFEADWGYWDSQWVMHLACFDLMQFTEKSPALFDLSVILSWLLLLIWPNDGSTVVFIHFIFTFGISIDLLESNCIGGMKSIIVDYLFCTRRKFK